MQVGYITLMLPLSFPSRLSPSLSLPPPPPSLSVFLPLSLPLPPFSLTCTHARLLAACGCPPPFAGDVLAIELLGPHNAASNTQRPLGPARIKWRLLAARGYRVIVINTWQWRSLEGPTRSRDGGDSDMGVRAPGAEVFSEKLLFLQSRLAGPIAAAVTAATAAEGAVQAAAGRVQGPGDPSPAASLEVQDGAGADTSSSSSVEAGSGGRGRVWPELQRPVRPQQSQVVKQVQQQVRQAMQQQQ